MNKQTLVVLFSPMKYSWYMIEKPVCLLYEFTLTVQVQREKARRRGWNPRQMSGFNMFNENMKGIEGESQQKLFGDKTLGEREREKNVLIVELQWRKEVLGRCLFLNIYFLKGGKDFLSRCLNIFKLLRYCLLFCWCQATRVEGYYVGKRILHRTFNESVRCHSMRCSE